MAKLPDDANGATCLCQMHHCDRVSMLVAALVSLPSFSMKSVLSKAIQKVICSSRFITSYNFTIYEEVISERNLTDI